MSNIRGLIFGTEETSSLRDIYFWLLLICINIGGNRGLSFILREQISLILISLVLIILYTQRRTLGKGVKKLLIPFCIIFIIQYLTIQNFSSNTTIHYIFKILMGILIVSLCGNKFPRYFSSIIFAYALISLVCFTLNCFGIIIPYFPIPESESIDGGHIFRVYNLFYTQLYNPLEGGGLTLRNCGPFWEPGAYQGFLNLSLWFELTMAQTKDRYYQFRIFIFIISIITTVSTGGYIVLFVIILHYFYVKTDINPLYKLLLILFFFALSIYLFFSLDFLFEKIKNDTIRTSSDFFNIVDGINLLIGYGLNVESFDDNLIKSVSSIINLFYFYGIAGFIIYILSFWKNETPYPFVFFIIVLLILTNEPFLSNVPLFWGLAFVSYVETNE